MRPRTGSVSSVASVGSLDTLAAGGWASDAAAQQPPGTAASVGSAGAGTRPSRLASAKPRVVVVAPEDEAGATGGARAPTMDAHAGMQRLASFMRRKSSFRGRLSSVLDLSAAMDSLDRRILDALEQLRAQNAAGLGHIRSLHSGKGGKEPSGGPLPASTRDLIPAYSPRGLLGSAVEDLSVLQRLKFHTAEQQGLHDASINSARGRLEGEPDLAAAGSSSASSAAEEESAELVPSESVAAAVGSHKKRHTISIPGLEPSNPKWGASEGGRDNLGWVRDMVKFGEAQQSQQQQGQQASSAGAEVDTIASLAKAAEEGVNGGTGAGRPARREDVLMLQTWLQQMMAQTLAQVPSGRPTTAASEAAGSAPEAAAAVAGKPPEELANAALWMYGVAFEELQRQVAVESRDRADLLGAMWEHCFNLVELRCSLMYEEVIGGIKEELQSSRRHRQQLQTQVKSLEVQLADARLYDKEEYLKMQAEKRRMVVLLGAAEEEAEAARGEAGNLKKALEVECGLRAAAEKELSTRQHEHDELAQRSSELAEQVAQQAGVITALQAENQSLSTDLESSRAQGRQLAEDKARLEVALKGEQREHQTAEILAMSLKEQLQARGAELAQLQGEHTELQRRHAATAAELQGTLTALNKLQREHEAHLRCTAEAKAEQQRSTERLEGALRDSLAAHAALQLEKQATDNALKESTAREGVYALQLKQLTAAHEAQGGRLKAETEARKAFEDEVQALRTGLQVSQAKLEGMGLVFACAAVHASVAQAWLATGPISMGRQVVAAMNQQLAELVLRQGTLEHELAVAKEHWQAEEGVRIRLQEQLLEAKAGLVKAGKEREAQEAAAARLEQQRDTLDREVTQMRKLVTEAEARAAAAHKKSLDAGVEARRLAPLEGQVARLEEAVRAGKAEADRLQHELAEHRASIRRLLDEKGAALEELSWRTQALDAATAEVRRLLPLVQDHELLQASSAVLQGDLQQLQQQRTAQESLLSQVMSQLAVAKQLLLEASTGPERDALAAAEEEVRRLQRLAASKAGEAELLQQRLTSTEAQLAFIERQLRMLTSHPPSAAPAAAPAGQQQQQQLGAVVSQLQRVLEVKEERIRQLERTQSSAAASSSQLKALRADVAGRDAEIGKLQRELEALRKRLHTLHAERTSLAKRDLVALATDARLPPDFVKELMHRYMESHLRSELVWARAKLGLVAHLARRLRGQLRAEQEARARAEVESVCVEAHCLHQAMLDQRAAAVLFDSTFAAAQQALADSTRVVAEARQLVAPVRQDLTRAEQQLAVAYAGLAHWLAKCQGRADQAVQVGSASGPLNPELERWQELLAQLPQQRLPALGAAGAGGGADVAPPLPGGATVDAAIVQAYAHRVEALMSRGKQRGPGETVFDALAAFFMVRHGMSQAEVASPSGPLAALLAAAGAAQHRPRQLLLGTLAGLAPAASSSRVPAEGGWAFVLQVLHCTARLLGASWQVFVQEWGAAEEGGAGLPLQCVLDVLANAYNTNAPALLDCARRALVPLVRQGRRGPAIDVDVLLLVLLNEFAEGRCPVEPLAMPRRLTDGSLANALNYHANPPALPALPGPSGHRAAGMADACSSTGAGVGGAAQLEGSLWRQKGPIRKRIVNLTDGTAAAAGASGGMAATPPPGGAAAAAAAAPSRGGSPAGSPGGNAAVGRAAGAPRSPEVFAGMQSLQMTNPGLALGFGSALRRSAATNPPPG